MTCPRKLLLPFCTILKEPSPPVMVKFAIWPASEAGSSPSLAVTVKIIEPGLVSSRTLTVYRVMSNSGL